MKSTTKTISLLIVVLFLLPVFSFAADVAEEEVTPRSRKIYLDPEREKNFFQKGKFRFLLSLSEGYDNNVFLDSRRDGDSFTQTFFKASYSAPVTEKTGGVIDFELMNLIYPDTSVLDLFRYGIHLGLNNKLAKDLTFTTGYYLDLIEYINTGKDDYFENMLEFRLKQDLPRKIYHSLGYEVSFRNFEFKHIRTDPITESDKKRRDIRHTAEYEIGKYFPKDLCKLNYQYYFNSSNEQFLKYYHYDSYKIGASVTHLFNDKIFGYLSFSRQLRDFRSRTITLDAGSLEWDKTYLATSALYYSLNKSLTLGLSYTYRENVSNEPLENYAGSLISVSTYYMF